VQLALGYARRVPGSSLAAGDQPVDAGQVEVVEWPKQRLGRDETYGPIDFA
jgi:hypothetical protein